MTALDFWQRHLCQVHPKKPWMNSFTRWRVSALYPVRPYIRKPKSTAPKPDRMRNPVKAKPRTKIVEYSFAPGVPFEIPA